MSGVSLPRAIEMLSTGRAQLENAKNFFRATPTAWARSTSTMPGGPEGPLTGLHTHRNYFDIPSYTANAMAGDRERALAAGCDEFDTKPVEMARLLGKIAALKSLYSYVNLTHAPLNALERTRAAPLEGKAFEAKDGSVPIVSNSKRMKSSARKHAQSSQIGRGHHLPLPATVSLSCRIR